LLENNIKYYAKQKWHGRVPFGNMDTESSEGCMAKGRCHPCAGEEGEFHLLLKYPETQRWGEKLMKSKWQHIKEERAIGKILTVKNATELRKLGTIACSTKCKR
jgi:hypothetical protein